MANESPPGDLADLTDQPAWVKAAYYIGWPIALAAFLLGIGTGLIPSRLSAAADALDKHIAHDQENTTLLRLICQHTARNEVERDACIGAGDGQVASR